jgi:hypothetical protein
MAREEGDIRHGWKTDDEDEDERLRENKGGSSIYEGKRATRREGCESTRCAGLGLMTTQCNCSRYPSTTRYERIGEMSTRF